MYKVSYSRLSLNPRINFYERNHKTVLQTASWSGFTIGGNQARAKKCLLVRIKNGLAEPGSKLSSVAQFTHKVRSLCNYSILISALNLQQKKWHEMIAESLTSWWRKIFERKTKAFKYCSNKNTSSHWMEKIWRGVVKSESKNLRSPSTYGWSHGA